MSVRRLIFTVLAAIGLLLPTGVSAAEAVPNCTLESVDQNSNRPQWRDVGMCDVLAVVGGSSVAPPSTVRVVHDSPSGTSVTMQTAQLRHYHSLRPVTYSCCRTISGYIYLIRCLRL